MKTTLKISNLYGALGGKAKQFNEAIAHLKNGAEIKLNYKLGYCTYLQYASSLNNFKFSNQDTVIVNKTGSSINGGYISFFAVDSNISLDREHHLVHSELCDSKYMLLLQPYTYNVITSHVYDAYRKFFNAIESIEFEAREKPKETCDTKILDAWEKVYGNDDNCFGFDPNNPTLEELKNQTTNLKISNINIHNCKIKQKTEEQNMNVETVELKIIEQAALNRNIKQLAEDFGFKVIGVENNYGFLPIGKENDLTEAGFSVNPEKIKELFTLGIMNKETSKKTVSLANKYSLISRITYVNSNSDS